MNKLNYLRILSVYLFDLNPMSKVDKKLLINTNLPFSSWFELN